MIRSYFDKKDYPKINEGNICGYCKACYEECGENPYCCYRELCGEIKLKEVLAEKIGCKPEDIKRIIK